ncbi:MAG: SDR family NAD(P)-dependent oxidoreductase, partial [Actinomycetota bacterium]|nr:SDR family NAD(P)-dependent oxidoreductase [Actinomycetota bacterium]
MTTALITGANKGLGFQTASELAELGWTVWLGARNEQRGVAAAAALADTPGHVRFVQLDVTSDESVDGAATTLEDAGDGLDVLINNAGIIGPGVDVANTQPTDFLACFGVNLLGPVRVTNALMALLARSAHPRIVMVSSGIRQILTPAAGDPTCHDRGHVELAPQPARPLPALCELRPCRGDAAELADPLRQRPQRVRGRRRLDARVVRG